MNFPFPEAVPYSFPLADKPFANEVVLNPLPYNLDAIIIRRKLSSYVSRYSTYSEAPVNWGYILAAERNDVARVKLETYIEVREIVRKSLPFASSSHIIANDTNPQNVNIWAIEVESPNVESYEDKKIEVELENTSEITNCTLCLGNGYKTCASCHGAGKLLCTTCNGNGSYLSSANCNSSNSTNDSNIVTRICSSCSGCKQLLCSNCNHTGRSKCKDCHGSGLLKKSSFVMVHFKTRENSHIVARDMADFELWREREGSSANIWEKSNHGSIVTSGYKESRYLPFAVIHPITITNIPLTYNVNVDKEELPGVAFDSAALADNIMDACRYVVSASNSRNQTAGSSYERVLAQRLSVDVLSLSKVHLQYEKKDFNFWMYGTQWDELTEENRYPERIWSSYCTIL